METSEDKEKLTEFLVEELDLTPYESKAYLAVLLYGPLTPMGVNQRAGIPRPRTYDVLNSLVGKGLLIEQPGRPRIYSAVNPKVGLERMMRELERRMLRQIEEKRKSIEKLISDLSVIYDKRRKMTLEEERVWVTRRNSSLIAKYSEAIKSIEKEIVVATAAPSPPEREILEAVKHVLRKKKSVRVIRSVTPQWTREELDEYEKLIQLSDHIRCLEYDGLTFAVFDRKYSVLWFPPYPSSLTVWIRLPSLADILYEYFETLWKKAQPALPIIRKAKEQKKAEDSRVEKPPE